MWREIQRSLGIPPTSTQQNLSPNINLPAGGLGQKYPACIPKTTEIVDRTRCLKVQTLEIIVILDHRDQAQVSGISVNSDKLEQTNKGANMLTGTFDDVVGPIRFKTQLKKSERR